VTVEEDMDFLAGGLTRGGEKKGSFQDEKVLQSIIFAGRHTWGEEEQQTTRMIGRDAPVGQEEKAQKISALR